MLKISRHLPRVAAPRRSLKLSAPSWVLLVVLVGSVLAAAVPAIGAPPPSFGWAGALGGSGQDDGTAVAVDGSGDVLVTGKFEGTADFDPGGGVSNLTSVGGDDVFVAKLNSAGTVLWARAMGGPGREEGNGVAVDGSDNVYVTGGFEGTADFGGVLLESVGSADIFVAKLNSAGTVLWAKAMGGPGILDFGNGLAVDGSGNVVVIGEFFGTADFDPGLGVSLLTPAGEDDVFVVKLDSDGNFVWARAMGGSASDQGDAVAVDGSGNVYVAGEFRDTFDPGPGVSNLTAVGQFDVFVAKLNSGGNVVWAGAMGGGDSDEANGVAVDGSGNVVYITGGFTGTADFNPGGGVSNLTSAGGGDVFVSKLNSDGSFVWARAMGGSGINDLGKAVVVDGSGNVLVTGAFDGTADFDPESGVSNLTAAGGVDVFVSKLNSAGTLQWAQAMGGAGGGTTNEKGNGVAVDGSGNVYVAGLFIGPSDFDPGPGVFTLDDSGQSDAFVTKLVDIPPPPVPPVAYDQSVTTAFNTAVAITLVATDVNGDSLTYSIVADPDPAHGTLSSVIGNGVTFTPINGYAGPASFTFTANDGTDDSNEATVSIDVNGVPVPNRIADQSPNEGDTVSLTATASDPYLGALTWTKVSGPGAVTSGGAYSWATTETDGGGTFPVTLRVSDGLDTADVSFNISVAEVNQPPSVTNPGNQLDGEGASPTIGVLGVDADLPANTLGWTAGGLPPGLNIDSATGEISGTVSLGAANDYAVTVTATDNGVPPFGNSVNFIWTIVDTNRSPVLNPIGPKAVDEGSLLAFTATATDPDPSDTLTFTLAGTPPPGTSITAAGAFTWTPTEAQGPGVYNITIRVTDNGTPNLSDAETITVTVAEVASPLPPPLPTPPPPPSVLPGALTPAPHDVGLVDPVSGLWHLRKATTGAVTSFTYGVPGDIPFMGDWDCNGTETPGLYRQSDGFAYIRNSNSFGVADVTFFMGNPSDIPLAGDFNGDGCDTVSIYRPGEQRIYIANSLGANNGAISADFSYIFGNPGDKPFVGDFNGNGSETIGLHRESTGFVYFRNTHTIGNADVDYFFGDPGDRLVAGDWGVVDGVFTPAVFRPPQQTFYFRHTNTQGNADSQFAWPQPNAGTWRTVSGVMGL